MAKRYQGHRRKQQKTQPHTPEDWDSTVANSTGTNARLPVRLLALEVQSLCARTGRNDDRIRRLGLLILLHLPPIPKRARRQVDLGDGFGDDAGSEPQRLFAELFHKLRAQNARGEPREVLDCGDGGI